MEAAANRLQKEAKGYLDSLRGGSPCANCLSIVDQRDQTDISGNPQP